MKRKALLRSCELAEGRRWNSAVLINRQGSVVGTYHKVFPVYGCPHPGTCEQANGEQGITPGWDGVGAFELDFGRVSMLICFDINVRSLPSSFCCARTSTDGLLRPGSGCSSPSSGTRRTRWAPTWSSGPPR